MPSGQRGRFDATVVFNRPICREHYLLRLYLPSGFPPTRAGQFVQLGCRPPDSTTGTDWVIGSEHAWDANRPFTVHQPELCAAVAFLRRPFSIADRGDDNEGTWLDIIHRVVGVGTAWLAGLNARDPTDLIGPLGNCFVLPEGKSIGLLAGGGVGLPPMVYLAKTLCQARWKAVALVGAQSDDLLAVTRFDDILPCRDGRPSACVQEFARYGYDTVITTDDGSIGLPGRITKGLERLLQSQSPEQAAQTVIYTCGPQPMMRSVANLAASYTIDCQVCLEQSMACGMGTCQSCAVQIEDTVNPQAHTEQGRPWRYRLTCTDGPVFPATDVVWPS